MMRLEKVEEVSTHNIKGEKRVNELLGEGWVLLTDPVFLNDGTFQGFIYVMGKPVPDGE